MRKSTLSIRALTISGAVLVVALSCKEHRESRTLQTEPCAHMDPHEPDTLCEKLDPHVANAERSNHLRTALLNLLRARQCSRRVSGVDTKIERAIYETLVLTCGSDESHRKEVIDNVSLDALFPPLNLRTAVSAGCGVLYQPDGTATRGKGVDWEP